VPERSGSMDGGGHYPPAPVEPTASGGVSVREPGDGAGALGCAHGGEPLLSAGAGAQSESRAVRSARILLGGAGATRRSSARTPRGEGFCAARGVGTELGGRESRGASCRCEDVRATLGGGGGERRGAWPCDSGGVARGARAGEARLAQGRAAAAAPGAGGRAPPLLWDWLSRCGWSARWLLQRIVRGGWHPRLRINRGGTVRPAQRAHSQPLRALVPAPGPPWVGTGAALQGPRRRRTCPWRVRGDAG
jgi:hypothetical protein